METFSLWVTLFLRKDTKKSFSRRITNQYTIRFVFPPFFSGVLVFYPTERINESGGDPERKELGILLPYG